MTRIRLTALVLPLLITLAGCNVFDPFDTPTSEAQLLSAARACFDRGDISCAREAYAKLSGTDSAEVAASEEAFAILDEQGAGMGAFITSMADGDASQGLTTMAGKLSVGAGLARRKAIYEAYLKVSSISSNTGLRGLVRFVTGFALAAEILAEDSGGDGKLSTTDLADDPTACVNNIATCLTISNCTRTGTVLSGAAAVDLVTSPSDTAMDGASPTWGQFSGTIGAISSALTNELASNGKFKTGTLDVAVVLAALSSSAPDCLRATLLQQGFGE